MVTQNNNNNIVSNCPLSDHHNNQNQGPIVLTENEITYYCSLESVRRESEKVYELVKKYPDESNFIVDETKLNPITHFIKSLIHRDYLSSSSPSSSTSVKDLINLTPYHGRWRHFNVGNIDRIGDLLKAVQTQYGYQKLQKSVMLFDLFIVGVLLDAGAGNQWKYKEKMNEDSQQTRIYERSEGLAVATYHMFIKGKFSSNPSQSPYQVDSIGLSKLRSEDLIEGFQHDPIKNPLTGIEGRFSLLKRLGIVIDQLKDLYFTSDTNTLDSIYAVRPGNLVHYLIKESKTTSEGPLLSMKTLWDALMKSLSSVWPESRVKIKSLSTGLIVPIGDIWPLQLFKHSPDMLVPFHKLTQWLSYSLIEPLETIMGVKFTDTDLLTALAEYRNGGLLIDFGLLRLKDRHLKKSSLEKSSSKNTAAVPTFQVNDAVIVEWRALTIHYIDIIAKMIREDLALTDAQYPLAKILEAGTWKAGREIARKNREASGGGPPIAIISDGTLF